MIAEYSHFTTRKPQVVMKVIRGEEGRRHSEASFKAEEGGRMPYLRDPWQLLEELSPLKQ